MPLSHAVCLADLRNQLLCPKTSAMFPFSWDFPSCARQRNRSSFTDVHFWTCKYMGHKTDVCRFCSLIIEISFFVIPKVFFFLSMCFPLLEYLFEEIYAWEWTHFPKHRLVIEPRRKTLRKKVQRKSKAFFLLKLNKTCLIKLYTINSWI